MKDSLKLDESLLSVISNLKNQSEIDQFKGLVLGKNGLFNESFRSLSSLLNDEKSRKASFLNSLKKAVVSALKKQEKAISPKSSFSFHPSLPVLGEEPGSVHPISYAIDQITDYFLSRGFVLQYVSDIQEKSDNFTALNFPSDHPAQDEHNTFLFSNHVSSLGSSVLRTHTSTVQIHFMKNNTPPFSFFTCGKVYRRDNDSTHSPVFHQLEIASVRKSCSIADLRKLIKEFILFFFKRDVVIRFRSQYFPFTEPSEEVDILFVDSSGNEQWIEICGCGLIHENVLGVCGISSSEYSGYAAGFGIERLVMLREGLADLREFFHGNIAWHKKWGINPSFF